MLKAARVRVGLSLADAATRVREGLDVAADAGAFDIRRLDALETGHDRPTLLELEAISATYLVTFVDLLQPELKAQPLHDYRLGPDGISRGLSYETRVKLAEFDRLYDITAEAWYEARAGGETAIPRFPDSHPWDAALIEDAARDIRATIAFDLRDESAASGSPEPAWTAAVERTGVVVMHLSMNPEECRGASRWDPDGPPSILLNRIDAETARLFTLLHEYAHLTLSGSAGRTSICDPSEPRNEVERLANQLAAAVLLPEDALRELIPAGMPASSYADWDESLRRALRRRFSVSHLVIGLRLMHLGIVRDPGVRPSSWRHTVGRGFGKRQPAWQRLRRNLGARGSALIRQAVATGAIDPVTVARRLDAKVSDVERAFA